MKNLAAAEKYHGHVMEASFDPPKEPKRDYFVPHFGEDEDILATKKNIAAAEKALGHEYDTSPPPKDPPRDYFVPHFGEDEDIKSTKAIIAATEKKLGHEYDTSDPPADPKRDYFVPNFGEDEDLTFTKRNIASAEKKYGTWTVKRDGNGAWMLPSVDENKFGNFKAENNWPSDQMPSLVQTSADIKVESDPICSSAGCTQYKHKTKDLGYDINYFVPNFGRDHLINQNFDSLDLAEKQLGHKWVWHDDKDEDIPTYHHKAMDPDIVDSLKNLED